MENFHTPVLLKESIEALQLRDNGIYVDATLGGGGHTEAILKTNKEIKIFAFDKDKESIKQNKTLSQKYPDNLKIINDNFANLRTSLALERIKRIDGILFDLGVSSHQINEPARGFSFMLDGKLDMRMDKSSTLTAFEIINKFPYEKLKKIFWEYGEEKNAARIARSIIHERKKRKIISTLQLGAIIEYSIKSKQKSKAKARIFQALRIYINGELEALKTALKDAVKILNTEGRIAVISYHSLEDRVVKKFFQYEEKACICPSSFPKCVCDKKSTLKIITKKPITPSLEEIKENKRARSAKLRIAEKKEVS